MSCFRAALVVRAAGPGCSVQDGGRFGYRRYGVTTAGPMDALAHATANRALGNPAGAAALEVSLGGIELAAEGAPLRLACAGGAFSITLDGTPLPPAVTLVLEPGAVLAIRAGERGAWCSVAVAGALDLPPVLGARATQARAGLGGVAGRCLREGDRIFVLPAGSERCLAPEALLAPWLDRPSGLIRVLPGPQDDFFSAEALAAFCAGPWTVGPNSDRMAWLLQGRPLTHARGYNIVSDGVAMGAVQVPGEGLPFVLMADCQPTGGYPKIATVIGADLGRLAQARPGTRLRFRLVTYAEAVAARREQAELCTVVPARAPLIRRNLAAAEVRGASLGTLPRLAGMPPPGRLSAAEQLEVLLDAGSFCPEAPGETIGTGRIAGRTVRIAALHNLPVSAAVAEAAVARAEPLIVLLDGLKAEKADEAARLAELGRFGAALAAASAAPRLGVLSGPLLGPAAVAAGLVDFLVLAEDAGPLAFADAATARALNGESSDDQSLGGAGLHAATGLAALRAANEVEALAAVRRLLSYLPWRGERCVLPVQSFDSPCRESPFLARLALEAEGVDDMAPVLAAIADEGDFLELAPGCGASLITGLTRLDGYATAVLASQPRRLGGALDAAALRKGTRFVQTCARLGLPLVTLLDCPGLLPGLAEASAGQLGLAAVLLRAYAAATVSKVSLVTGIAYGVAALMQGRGAAGADAAFVWPRARIAPIDPAGAAARAFAAERDDPERFAAHLAAASGALSGAAAVSAGLAQAVIAPRATRARLIAALAAARKGG